MKRKIFLLSLGIGAVSFALRGQTTPFLYNKGVMSVVSSTQLSTVTTPGSAPVSSDTKLFIGGDFYSDYSGTASNSTAGSVYMKSSQMVITGDLYRLDRPTGVTEPSNVFSLPTSSSEISNTAANQSNVIFRSNTTQHIWTASKEVDRKYYYETKAQDYVMFPNLWIENPQNVVLHPEMAARTYDLTVLKGKFIIDARAFDSSKDVLPTASTYLNNSNASVLAFLRLDGTHKNTYLSQEQSKAPLSDYGSVQVNLRLTEPTKNNIKGEPFAGFGSPFKSMYADYFMFNTFFQPAPGTDMIVNAVGNTMTNPELKLSAGDGFVIGLDLRGDNANDYLDVAQAYNGSKGVKIDFADRFKGEKAFNRFAFSNSNANNLFPVSSSYTSASVKAGYTGVRPSTSSAYTDEVLVGTDVSKTLVKGFNYLANPYTCPLDLSAIVSGNGVSNTANAAWNVIPGYDDGTSPSTQGNIASRVWMLSDETRGSAQYNILAGETWDNGYRGKIYFQYSYRLMATTGGTYSNGQDPTVSGSDSYFIAPLQMFVLYSRQDGLPLKIPASARVMKNGALFLRSTQVESSKDDFLFQVTDLDTKQTDRVAVVLRTPEEILKGGCADAIKLRTAIITDTDNPGASSNKQGDVSQSGMSILYTKNTDGTPLESKFLQIASDGALNEYNNVSSTVLYLTPAASEKKISIRSFRNETKDRVDNIYLVDTKNNVTTLLSEDTKYDTTTSPTDKVDRFILKFERSYSGIGGEIINPSNTDIFAHYSDNTLTVSGFNDADYGSVVSVFDIQGRLLDKTNVQDVSVQFRNGYPAGAYIVKVTGNRSYVTKFLAK